MPISDYSTTASENDTAGSVNFSEGQNPSTVNNSARQVMADIRAQWQDAERFDWGHTVTWASSSTFNIASDVTAQYITDRAIRCYGPTMGVIDTYVVSSTYSSPNTTVTVVSTGLLGDLSQAYLGIISNSTALPKGLDIQVDTINGASSDENTILGIGTSSPKPVHTTNSAVQVGNSGWIMSPEGSNTTGSFLTLASNVSYPDGTWDYIITDFASMIDLDSSGNIVFYTAPSGTGGTGATLTVSSTFYNGGGALIGSSGSNQGAGTLSAQNGLFHGSNRNNRTVILDTPELITSTPTTGAWTTVNNTTLNTAAATGAIIRAVIISSSGSAAVTDYAWGVVSVRKTGDTISYLPGAVAGVRVNCSVVGQVNDDYGIGTTTVALDGSYDFDYYVLDTTSGGGSSSFDIYLIGYIQNC